MVQVQNPQGAPASDTQDSQDQTTGQDRSDPHGEWRDWMSRPSNRAALMQFGIAMMQPIGIGQSAIGNIANAVGEGGEAAQRVGQQELLRQREESQEDLRGAQADLAGQRAGVQGDLANARMIAANAAEERAKSAGTVGDLKQQNLDLSRLTKTFQMQNEARKRYENEVTNNIMIPDKNKPTFSDFLTQNPELDWRIMQGQHPAGELESPAPTLQQREAVPAQSYKDAMARNPAVKANIENWKTIAKNNPNDPRLQQWLQAIKPIYRDYPALRQELGLPRE